MTQEQGTRRQRRNRNEEPEIEVEEKEEVKPMAQATTQLADMSPEQRDQAFEKWMSGQENKKATNTAKRNAANILKGRYEEEYNKIFSEEKVRLAGG